LLLGLGEKFVDLVEGRVGLLIPAVFGAAPAELGFQLVEVPVALGRRGLGITGQPFLGGGGAVGGEALAAHLEQEAVEGLARMVLRHPAEELLGRRPQLGPDDVGGDRLLA
jgi:hypothetical protein